MALEKPTWRAPRIYGGLLKRGFEAWIVQQARQAFPESCSYRYAILNRDGKFGEEVTELK